MKNQIHRGWLWQGLMTTALLITVGASNAFANANSCANPWELTLDGQVKIKFCDIPAAPDGVMIGSEYGESDETPVRSRSFKKFQMAQFEVTQLQYKTVTGAEPWKENGNVKSYVQEGNDNPAVHVSYIDAAAFARILSLKDDTATYRLPTEAEFEYAARAETTSNYYWGDEIDPNFAYFWGNTETTGLYGRKVDSCPTPKLNQKYPGYCANDYGLYHMLGNVWEWTGDAYESSYANASTEGNVPVAGSTNSFRVLRGGCWFCEARFLRSANRHSALPVFRSHGVGFRVVRIAK